MEMSNKKYKDFFVNIIFNIEIYKKNNYLIKYKYKFYHQFSQI